MIFPGCVRLLPFPDVKITHSLILVFVFQTLTFEAQLRSSFGFFVPAVDVFVPRIFLFVLVLMLLLISVLVVLLSMRFWCRPRISFVPWRCWIVAANASRHFRMGRGS